MKKLMIIIIMILSLIEYAHCYNLKYRIVDGDTIIYNGVKIRLYGIDTPESYIKSKKAIREARKCKISLKQERELGLKAKEHLKELLKNHDLKIKIIGRGYYGRALGIIYVDGVNINKKMVEDGYACSYRGRQPYETYEQKAKVQKAGLWNQYFETMNCLCSD